MIKLILFIYMLSLTLVKMYSFKASVPEINGNEILHFEFGSHVPEEELSYFYATTIPAFTPIFMLNVTPTDPALERRFTFLKAEYVNPVSMVTVSFDPHTLMLTIHQKFPFLSMPLGVYGYSLPIRKFTLNK